MDLSTNRKFNEILELAALHLADLKILRLSQMYFYEKLRRLGDTERGSCEVKSTSSLLGVRNEIWLDAFCSKKLQFGKCCMQLIATENYILQYK